MDSIRWLVVDVSIDLKIQRQLTAEKVQHESPVRELPAELESETSSPAEDLPGSCFCPGGPLSEFPRQVHQLAPVHRARSLRDGQAPSPEKREQAQQIEPTAESPLSTYVERGSGGEA